MNEVIVEPKDMEGLALEIYTDLVNSGAWESLMNKLLLHALDKLQDNVVSILSYKLASNQQADIDIVKIVSDTIEHL